MNKGKKLYSVGRAGFWGHTSRVFAFSAKEAVERFVKVSKVLSESKNYAEFEAVDGTWWKASQVAA